MTLIFLDKFLENSKTSTVAAIVPFVIEGGKLDFKTGKALWNSIEYGLLENKKD